MKKRMLTFFVAIVFAFSLFTIPSSAAGYAKGVFSSDSITYGTLSATVTLYNTTETVTFAIAYYSKDDILLACQRADLTIEAGKTNAKTTIKLPIPDDATNGDYAKIIAMEKDSLEPLSLSSAKTIYRNMNFITNDAVSYDGLSERYYTLTSPNGSVSVDGREVHISDKATPLRLKDMSDGEFAFEDYAQPRYRLEYTEESGIRMYYYSAGSAKQRWILEEYNDGYAISNSNGGYLAIENGTAIISDSKYEWSLNFLGETPFSLMTSLDGFKLFTEKQQQRIIEICTSVGADAMPYAPNGDSFLDDCEAVFTRLYNGNYTAEEEKAEILAAVSKQVIGELAESGFYYSLPSFPGGDATVTQSSPTKTTHEMWDLVEENGVIYSASEEHPYTGKPINCYLINVTYKTEDTTQNVKVYCVDPNFANVQTAINALGKFPYAYRQHIKNMYVYLSTTTSTYNCGGEELFVRLKGTANETTMIKSFAHELGHSNDYMANGDVNNRGSHWSQGTKWQLAVEDDIATISNYGNSNSDEGFAEFARLYWLCYGNRDLQIGIKQLYPNRFASFQRMLEKIGCESEVLY